MNKYQKALDWTRDGNDSCGTEWDLIQELVDKEIPMKPIKIIRNRHEWKEDIINLYEATTCGKCFYELQKERINNFRSQCGQKIDWSDEDVED